MLKRKRERGKGGGSPGVYVAGVCADVASLHDMVGWRVQLRRGCMTTSGAHPPARCLPGGHALPNRRGERLDGLLQQAGEVGHVEADGAADVVAAVCLAGVVCAEAPRLRSVRGTTEPQMRS